MARLFLTDVLAGLQWRDVWLLDINDAVFEIPVQCQRTFRRAQVVDELERAPRLVDESGANVALPDADAAVLLAVPRSKLGSVAAWLMPHLGSGSMVFDLGSEKSGSLAAMANARDDLIIFGTHPLFGNAVGTFKGQTVVMCPSLVHRSAHHWLARAIEAAGGTVEEMSPEKHDLAMTYVQTAAHQALMTFADVVGSSGLDVDEDLWKVRTPQFETLLGMASRVLLASQIETIAAIQVSTSGGRIAEEMMAALSRLRSVVRTESTAEIADHLEGIRKFYDEPVFERMRVTSNAAVVAVQQPRRELAEVRNGSELVAVAQRDQKRSMRIGIITGMTATSIELRNLLLGQRGSAILADRNQRAARKLGVNGKVTQVSLMLSKVDIFSGFDLEPILEEWLGSIQVDVRLTGPDSIAGSAAVLAVLGHPRVRDAELVSEGIWLGRREYVIRCSVRADHDPSTLSTELQNRFDGLFAWPRHAIDSSSLGVPGTVGFHGPVGSPSESAAQILTEVLAESTSSPVSLDSYSTLLEAVWDGTVGLAVLPLVNSATGLIEDAASALCECRGRVVGHGVIDREFGFDIYGRPGQTLRDAQVVVSEEQGLRHCRQFIDQHGLEPLQSESIAGAATDVLEGRADLVIAPTGATLEGGLHVVAGSVRSDLGDLTRHIVLGRRREAENSARRNSGTRAVWIVSPGTVVPNPQDHARFDERIIGDSGYELLVSTDPGVIPEGYDGVSAIGSFLWSPRFPLATV